MLLPTWFMFSLLFVHRDAEVGTCRWQWIERIAKLRDRWILGGPIPSAPGHKCSMMQHASWLKSSVLGRYIRIYTYRNMYVCMYIYNIECIYLYTIYTIYIYKRSFNIEEVAFVCLWHPLAWVSDHCHGGPAAFRSTHGVLHILIGFQLVFKCGAWNSQVVWSIFVASPLSLNFVDARHSPPLLCQKCKAQFANPVVG